MSRPNPKRFRALCSVSFIQKSRMQKHSRFLCARRDSNPRPLELENGDVGGDVMPFPPRKSASTFQFTPPRRGRLWWPLWFMFCGVFQFTPPRRGRHHIRQRRKRTMLFQFTPPRRGRPIGRRGRAGCGRFQFTPPRRGRRIDVWYRSLNHHNFNSRPRVGGDLCRSGVADQQHRYFNSRPRVGGDGCTVLRTQAPTHFNSRPRVGGDLHLRCNSACTGYFNSRPRVGGDVGRFWVYIDIRISIHAPA